MADPAQLLFLRDVSDVEPPREKYADYDKEDIYRRVPKPEWVALDEEIWDVRTAADGDPEAERIRALMKKNLRGSDISVTGGMIASRFAKKLARRGRRSPRSRVRKFLENRSQPEAP